MKELKGKYKNRNITDMLFEIFLWVSIVVGTLLVILSFLVALLGLFTTPVHASEPLNVTNVHYTADNGLQTENTFTLREGYRERIYYQIDYTGDGNPADLMLMWNDYQGIEITVQQYTQASGVMLVRYNESFSGWGVTGFWVQGGNGNGKRMLRFRSQPNTPPEPTPEPTPVTTSEATPEPTVEQPAPVTTPEQPTQTEAEENTNVLQQQPTEQPTEQPNPQPTNEGVTNNQPNRTDITTDGERGHETAVSMEEKTPKKTVESKEKPQEAVSDELKEKEGESSSSSSNRVESKPEPKKNTKDIKEVVRTVIVWGLIVGNLTILISERVGKKK